MAFGCLSLALLMAGGLVWRSAQSIVTPFVIEVDNAGQVRAVGEAASPYKPNDAQIAHHLARFVIDVRSLSIDPIVVRQNWLEAYEYTTDRGAATLNDYARANDPFSRIGQSSVAVEVTSVVRASDTFFQVRWIERSYANGASLRDGALDGRAVGGAAAAAHRAAPAQEPARHLRQRAVLEP